jgi:hypothetical protein
VQLLREALFLLLTFLDVLFTERKILEMGLQAELNPVIRKLVLLLTKKTRLEWAVGWGVFLGIMIPAGGQMALGWFNPNLLSFLIGIRFCLFLFQRQAETNGK